MGKPTILCVDDEIFVLRSLRQQLEFEFGTKYNIEIAESGQEALELFEELVRFGEEIPLVITDYIMPKMKGDELLKRIHEQYPQTVSILLTGQATLQGIKNAVNDTRKLRYIAKPWERDVLYTFVYEMLEIYHSQKHQTAKNESLRLVNQELEQMLEEKIHELESKKKAFHDMERIAVVGKLAEDISKEISSSLQSIKSGTEIIHAYIGNISENNPLSVEACMESVDNFYKATSEIIKNLVITFERNIIRYITEPSGSGELAEILYQTSSMRGILSDAIHTMMAKAPKVEKPAKASMEKVVAWDDEEIVLFNVDEVLFFTTESNSTVVITKSGKYKVKEGLEKLEKKLGSHDFFRCHRGYLVNLNCVNKIMPWVGNNSHILKIAEHEIPISRNRIKEMKTLLGIA